MSIWAISDLHLPAGVKPMDVFGSHWKDHCERIRLNWLERVASDDIVLLPGDLSWAMNLSEFAQDAQYLGELPGQKLLVRGNHDYWWSSIGRVRAALPKGCLALQNDFVLMDGMLFAGSRGWLLPSCFTDASDEKYYQRERIRLELSLQAARSVSQTAPLYALIHYPPCTSTDEGFSDLLEKYKVNTVVYGHLHGTAIAGAFRGIKNGIRYELCSCDSIGFAPMLVV